MVTCSRPVTSAWICRQKALRAPPPLARTSRIDLRLLGEREHYPRRADGGGDDPGLDNPVPNRSRRLIAPAPDDRRPLRQAGGRGPRRADPRAGDRRLVALRHPPAWDFNRLE